LASNATGTGAVIQLVIRSLGFFGGEDWLGVSIALGLLLVAWALSPVGKRAAHKLERQENRDEGT
jgi:hypothetical protein